jgi:ribosomal protein S18 acetylase RimI-like enzyme
VSEQEDGRALVVRPIASAAEREACARLMSDSEPWRTLGRDYETSLALLSDPTREAYWIEHAGAWAGFLLLYLHGPFRGYIQTICLDPACRGHGVGTMALGWAEERIFRESPNVFLCVSDFNRGALRLYQRLGYELVGALPDFLVSGSAELLLRKTRGPWVAFRPSPTDPTA